MNPRLYLSLSNALIGRVRASDGLVSAGGESECRDAISRAYYAAYHVAVDLLSFLRIGVCDSGLCHSVTKKGLNNSGDAALATVSVHLGTMYSLRRRADYDMHDTVPEKLRQAEEIAKIAQNTISILESRKAEYGQNPAKGLSVAQTILAWATTAGQKDNLFKK